MNEKTKGVTYPLVSLMFFLLTVLMAIFSLRKEAKVISLFDERQRLRSIQGLQVEVESSKTDEAASKAATFGTIDPFLSASFTKELWAPLQIATATLWTVIELPDTQAPILGETPLIERSWQELSAEPKREILKLREESTWNCLDFLPQP